MTPSFSDALIAALLSSWPSLLLDGMLLFLLLCVVLYAVRLIRAVNAIHRGKAELAWLFARFAENIARAEKLLKEMKRSALESQEVYLRRKEETDRLANDIGYLIEKGNGLADHLEETIGIAKETSIAKKGRRRNAENNAENSLGDKPAETIEGQRASTGSARAALSIPNLHNLR